MPSSSVHLDLEERRRLHRRREAKVPVARIAAALGRHRSTIHREIGRNGWHDAEGPQAEGYGPPTAQDLAMRRRRASAKLERHAGLRDAVMDRLRDGGSPEPIAGRRRVEPAARRWLCHETIHRFVRSRKGRSEELARPLPSRRRRRRPRRSSKPGSPVFPDHAAARHRPAAVTDRAEFGRRSGGPRDRAPRARGRERGHGRGADDPLHRALPKPRPPLEARHGPPHRRARAPARHGAAQPPPRAPARVRLLARARSWPRRPRLGLRPPGAPAEGHP